LSWRIGSRPLRRVLVTRLRYLGDVVMATVVADALKAGDPDLDVGFLCETAHAAALAGHPSLDRLHLLGARRRGRDAAARGGGGSSGRGTLGLVAELRQARYDLAVDLFFNPRSAWLLYLSGIPLRIGGTSGSRRRLYTHVLPRRMVEDPAGVLARTAPGGLGEHLCRLAPLVHEESGQGFLPWLDAWTGGKPLAPRLPAPAPSEAAKAALTAAGADPDRPYLLMAPGATWPAKQWPAAHWSELAREAERSFGLQVVTLAPPGRRGEWPDLPRLLEPLPLPDVLPLLAGARAVTAVDGGVMHCAVALGTPTLALFGPTDPAIWFPYEAATASRVLATRPPCHPCNRHECPVEEFVCLPGLGAGKVAAALADMLEATGGRKGNR
jgi:ADP-heptose:LPS heptosyltransferase